MKPFYIFLFAFCFACTSQDTIKQITFHKKVHDQDRLVIMDDTMTAFPDSFPLVNLQSFELSKDSVEIVNMDSLGSRIKIAKLKNKNSPTYNWHFFVEDQSAKTIRRWWLKKPLSNEGSIIECKLSWWFVGTGSDTMLRIEYQFFKNSGSPYFYEDWTQSGFQIWDLKNQKCLAQLFPINTEIEKGDIIKGEYDEEVDGSPTIGTIVYKNVLRYQTDFSEQGFKFTLTENSFLHDSTDLGDYYDSSEVAYRKNLIQPGSNRSTEYLISYKEITFNPICCNYLTL